jgi:DNA mismatch repair protein MutL
VESRIAVLPAALADQIAAGEVVERPASIVKELIDNAIDAGATRVEIELEQGGRESIRVIDDGRGIHPDDLLLALTRHATSKLHEPGQLIEIHTLGFRGEALASVAAVAQVEIRSRQANAPAGRRARAQPGQPATIEPIGMPFGTQVEVSQLFASVPARRKFLRSEATEIGHCIDAVVRVALVHPHVHVIVRHGRRELLALPAGDQASRVAQVLARSGAIGPLHEFAGEREGTSVHGWFAPPEQAQRQRSGAFVVVRRRVVRERTLGQLLRWAYGDALAGDAQPLAVLIVEPPPGTVDVNVHPQKSEVRFADAQRLFAVVRELVGEGLADAPWQRAPAGLREDTSDTEATHDWARPRDASTRAALASWSGRGVYEPEPSRSAGSFASDADPRAGVGYRLGTRALGSDYASDKQALRGEAERLRSTLLPADRTSRGWNLDDSDHEPTREPDIEPPVGPILLGHLPGPVALFEDRGTLLAVDLRRLRAHLVRRRLLRELSAIPGQSIPAQGLLEPVVVRRRGDEIELLLRQHARLLELGVDLEGFGEGAVVVRAVPAVLRKILDDADVDELLERLIPWLRMREHADAGSDPSQVIVEAVAAIADTRRIDPTPRLARAWLADALREGPIDEVPGVRRWTGAGLLGAS